MGRRSFAFPTQQVILLFLLLGLGGWFILTTIATAPFSAVLLLGFVSVTGLLLCRITQARLDDASLRILGYLWLIKLGATLFLLYAGWIPQLDQASSDVWGYDPQRYYIQAQELIDQNWSIDLISLNYTGILYYYGAIFYAFGHNPVIPALINALVTLLAVLYLVKVGYEIKNRRGPRDWILAFALVLPEILWYDVMTSRETLMGALLLFACLTPGRYLARTAPIRLRSVFVVITLCSLGIAAVRASMLLPLATSLLLMALMVHVRLAPHYGARILIVIFVAAMTLFLPLISGYIGGYEFEADMALRATTTIAGNAAESVNSEWSQNSIGRLLFPENTFQAILFVPPRVVLYILSPIPKVSISVQDLLAGDYQAWQMLMTIPGSLINVFLVPYALASFWKSIGAMRANAASLVFSISYWPMITAIAGGNLIIQERYRVMATLLLWGCGWLGATTCSKSLIAQTSLLWYGLLFVGTVLFLLRKGLIG